MNTLTTASEACPNTLTTPIERLDTFPPDFDRDYRTLRRPVIVSRSVAGWRALQWTPETFEVKYGDVETAATVQLPEAGVVYLQKEKAHRRTLTVREFMKLMNDGACCYIDQADTARFPGLADACPLDARMPAGRRFVNLWVGARTRSGLHYDPMDNFFVQIYGDKDVMLAAPEDRRGLYPFADNVAKSRIDPEFVDTARYPRARQVKFFAGTVTPGDMLYIPRGWWHFLRARDRSMSLNLWHEPALTLADELGGLRALGPACWARITRDFVWHGMMRRPYEQRLYSPPPTGKQLYDLCAMRWSGRAPQ